MDGSHDRGRGRGGVRYGGVRFGPSIGGEIEKVRPAVVVSNDSANRNPNRVQVVPLTTNVSRLYPVEAFVTLAGRQQKAMTSQVTTASKTLFTNSAGRLPNLDMERVEQATKVQLGLD